MLFRQPLIQLRQDLFLHIFRHITDAGTMAAARLEVDLFILLSFENRSMGGTPRVDFTVNKDHLRIIVLQKIINLMIKGRAEFDLANQLFGQHDAVQITFTAVDSQVFTERLRVISVITQFTGGLNKERNIRLVLRKIVRTADIHQVFEQRRGIGMERRNNRYGRSPLP